MISIQDRRIVSPTTVGTQDRPVDDPLVERSRVLVIEDSPSDQSVYRRTLKAFDLSFADSGESGLERIAAEPFDLVILDYQLPRMNGAEVLAQIRSGSKPDLPVVIVTGGGSETVAVSLLRQGASDYVTKDDLHTPRIASSVRGSLERHRLDRARQRAEDELRSRKDELESALRKLQEAQAHLIQSEKMSSLGLLVSGVAHEINNPLAYATNNIAVLERDVREVDHLMTLYREHLGPDFPPEILEAEERIDLKYTMENLGRLLRSTRQGMHRVGEIVERLRDFARLDESDHKLVDPNEAVRITLDMIGFSIREKEIHLKRELASVPMIWCNPGQINQVLLNLLMNAIQAVKPGASIIVRSRSLLESEEVQLEVADDGPGIPEAIQGKIFDPFFTTKPQGVGTGLGLWVCFHVVEQHRGRIDVASEPGNGTTFTITLPLGSPDASA